MQGISRLEQFVEELSEKERAKQLKQEKKRQKRKNRRRNRCGLDILDQEVEIKEKDLDEVRAENALAGFTLQVCKRNMHMAVKAVSHLSKT